MGEQGAARESIACNQLAESHFNVDDNPHVITGIAHLTSFNADKLICVHSNASGYNNCKNDHTLEDALMIKSKGINGEMSIAS